VTDDTPFLIGWLFGWLSAWVLAFAIFGVACR
jgi:hypothetical protein